MKSRMEKYYNNEQIEQRTNKNDSLYDEIYKEKQKLNSNVTVIDNVNEIDINKIKEMVNNRENYKKVRKYENLINCNQSVTEEKAKYTFDEINDEDYDINQILKKKRIDMIDENNKIRKIDLSNIDFSKAKDNSYESRDEQIKELVQTIAGDDNSMDLFANLKQTSVEINTKKNDDIDKTELVKETVFYTSTNSFKNKDFKESLDEKDDDGNKGTTILTIITIVVLLAAIGIFVWYKFFK